MALLSDDRAIQSILGGVALIAEDWITLEMTELLEGGFKNESERN